MSNNKTKSVSGTWLWMPHPGHFIAAYSCHFVMNTYVGGYIVSTVGEYQPERKERFDWETIGIDRLYETMVFKATPETEPEAMCCPYTAVVEGGELDFEGYNDAVSAAKGHYKLCHKWSQEQVSDLAITDSGNLTERDQSAQTKPNATLSNLEGR